MAVYHWVYDKVICRLTVWRLGWASMMLKQSCLPLSLSSNNTVAISVTGCTDPLRDGQAELASMKMCVTSTIRFFFAEN